MSCKQMESQVCIVTGSSSGLGRAIALKFAEQGAKLVICADIKRLPPVDGKKQGARKDSSNDHELGSTDEIICRTHGKDKALFVEVDVTNSDQVKELIAKTLEVGGRLDVLVNNAGVGPVSVGLHEIPDHAWDLVMNVNVRGPFLCSKYAIKAFLEQRPDKSKRRGRIINIASAAGLKETRLAAAYCASKAATISLTKSTALDYAASGIVCNAICPGFIATPMTAELFGVPKYEMLLHQMTPLGLLDTAKQDIANAAVFLASNESTWITGLIMPVDGGYTVRC